MGLYKSKRNMSEKFSLKWNDFHSNASKSFGLLRNEDYLHDVTLVSDDQDQITAHKLVLSASSEYFKNIFRNNRISNPFLCLDGISSTDLHNILDYIYNGEIQIYQEHLDRFLAVAQRFKLEGLLGGDVDEEKEKKVPDYDPPPKRTKMREKVKQEHNPVSTIAKDSTTIQLSSNSPLDSSDMAEFDQKLYENMGKNSDGTYFCKICSKTNKAKKDMKFHVETHIEGLTFPCNTCGKEYRS